MNFPPQFIVVRLIPSANGKTDKIPLNAIGAPCDAHDPANWMTAEVAEAARVAVGADLIGFVFTENDPYFFIDLDGAAGPGDWQPWAKQICAAFPGAGMEISSSGTGLHIVGRCNKSELGPRKTRGWCPGVEVYFSKRFMAMNRNGLAGWMGNIDAGDWTATLAAWVPAGEASVTALDEGVAPDWTGPTDDDDLINRMHRQAPSTATAFGGQPSASDLWFCRVDVLARAYASATDIFDRSRADAALMSHLAYWTGRDQPRMDRLFRRSGLMREKYDKRADYRVGTIRGACQTTRKVYTHQRRAALVSGVNAHGSRPMADVAPLSVTPRDGSGIMFIPEMIEHFRGCIYVQRQHKVLIPDGEMIDQARFRIRYSGSVFQMAPDNTQPTKDAWEAFTQNRTVRFPAVDGTCFDPDLPFATVRREDEYQLVNVYKPYTREFTPGDVTPFFGLLRTLFPDDRDQAIILSYGAYVLQNPGRKARWAPVLYGPPGTGKTTLFKCIAHGFRPIYVHQPSAADMANQFNAYLENKLFIGVEEINTSDREEILEILKPLITDERVEVQPKGVDKYMVDNRANFWFNTNHKNAVRKTADDRRYAILWTRQQSAAEIEGAGLGGNYFPRFKEWLDNGGHDAIVSYLLDYNIPDEFNPAGAAHRAPNTSVTMQAIAATLSAAEEHISEAVALQLPGFRGGWISASAAAAYLKESRVRAATGPGKINEILTDMGYIAYGRASRKLLSENMMTPALWALRGIRVSADPTEDFCRAQEYLQDITRR